jgi:hypothetical protein
MTVFDYSAVIVSIVLALGMTQVLSGFANVLRNRERVVLHWPQLAWSVWLFMFHMQIWWSYWDVRSVESLGYFAFFLHLLWPVTLYLLSALAWPDFGAGPVNLATYFERHRRAFFGLLIAANIVIASSEILSGNPEATRTVLFLIPWIILYSIAIATRSARVHNVLAVLALVGMVYWVISFSPLVSGTP